MKMRWLLALVLAVFGAILSWPAVATAEAKKEICGEVPSTYTCYVARAKALIHFGYYDRAIVDLKKAIDLEAGSLDGHYYLGMAYEFDHQVDNAIEQYGIFLTLDPTADGTRKRVEDMKKRRNP